VKRKYGAGSWLIAFKESMDVLLYGEQYDRAKRSLRMDLNGVLEMDNQLMCSVIYGQVRCH